MRSFTVALALALAACGQSPLPPSPRPAGESVPAEWVGALTASPRTLRTYAPTEIVLEGTAGTIEQTPTGARVTTVAQLGAFGPVIDLGPEAVGDQPRVVRLNVVVERGTLQFVMTHRNFPPNYTPHVQSVAEGEATWVYLPADPNPGSILIIANGAAGENVGVITSAELLAAP